MINENGISVGTDTMRRLARYEETFEPYVGKEAIDFSETYPMTVEDLYAAIGNILKKAPTVHDFGEYWYYPLTRNAASFGIDRYTGENADRTGRGLLLSDADAFTAVWSSLEDVWVDYDEDICLTELSDELKGLLSELDDYLKNRGKPLSKREFSEYRMMCYLASFDSDEAVKEATEEERTLCRRFIEELCKKNNILALRMKGYACYGGNALYPCDWYAARDCIQKLFELTDDAQYANTLGYLYYYGRCSRGAPDYRKAFDYFTISAANGLHEGVYKLADMFCYGFACHKSPAAARALYGMAYADCRKKFLEGIDGAFSDAALRMGNVFLRGIGEEEDPEKALCYYLQADYANVCRMKNSDFFGNRTVTDNLQNSLGEVKEKLGNDYFTEYETFEQPWFLYELLADDHRIEILVEDGEDGFSKVTARRIPVRSGRETEPILVAMPHIEYCERTDKLTFYAKNISLTVVSRTGGAFKCDYCEWNWSEKRVDLYYDDLLIGWMQSDEYRFCKAAAAEEAPRGRLVRMASVSFPSGNRTYDYLCELPDVAAGDTVIVMGYDGETPVVVNEISEKYESELPLPFERYKSVLRKA